MVSVDPKKINAEELRNLFTDIRKTQNNRDNMDNLVEYLVDEETLSSCCYEIFNQTFCEAYTIKLLEKYIHRKKDRQLMLAIYGLLDGYKNKGIKERCEKYAKEAAEFDKRMKPYWSDANGSIRSKEENKAKTGIVDKLLKEIMTAVSNDGRVNYKLAKEVDEELSRKFPGGLPKELPLEKPLYLSKGRSGDTMIGKEIGDDILVQNDNPLQTGEIEDVVNDKKHDPRIWRLRIIIIILILVVIGFVVYVIFNNVSKQDKKENYESISIEGSIFQNDVPVVIHYSDGISVDLSVPAKVSRDENGTFTISNIDVEFNTVEDNERNDSQEGVDDYEKNQ